MIMTFKIPYIIHFPLHGATAPNGSWPPQYREFTITLRHTALGRIPLDEGSARRRDLYLTTHNSHKRQTCMAHVGFESPIAAREPAPDPRLRPRGHWDRHILQTTGQICIRI
jgi:hypothetical protein